MYCHKSPFVVLLASALLLGSATADAEGLGDFVNDPRLEDCKGVKLRCFKLEVPVDHRANIGPTVDIEFAISFAGAQSKGVVVIAVGGPGESGIEYARGNLGSYGKLLEGMDVVFFDPRGVGPDHGVDCPQAKTKFNLAQPSIRDPNGTIAIAKDFARNCPREFDSLELVNHLDTDQAVRDLELFRQAIGSPKIWIYGMSYGTQIAQRYATIFPTSVNGIIIDGVVDLHLDTDSYYKTYVLAAEKILDRVFAACEQVEGCGPDMNGDAAAAYNELSARAAAGPIEIDFPLAAGSFEKRELTAGMLENTAYLSLYSTGTRGEFLRALAAANRNNLVPLLELGYSKLSINPQTLGPASDPGNFPAAYFAVTCSDYGEGTANAEGTALDILAQAKAIERDAPRFLELYYMERLVCAFWPKRGPVVRPKQYAGGEFPTLVLNADADPITPLLMAQSVSGNATKASLVTKVDGPHVIFGYEDECVDKVVNDLLLLGTEPPRKKLCKEKSLVTNYAPLTLTDAASAEDPSTVMLAVESEIWSSQAFTGWDQEHEFKAGCDFGGTVTAIADPAEERIWNYDFTDCAWWPDIRLTGRAKVGEVPRGKIELKLSIAGVHNGTLNFRREDDTVEPTLIGTYDGNEVSVP